MCPGNNKGTIGQLHSNEECVSINEVLTRVGDKWSLQVISRLGEGTQRFTELRRSIDGISQRMLTLTPRQLDRSTAVSCTIYHQPPSNVENTLSSSSSPVPLP